jgi:hypothetical protein
LADGDNSLLYRSFVESRTRNFDSGANQVEGSIFLQNSPHYPAAFVGFSGLPTKYLNVTHIDELRSQVVEIMKKVASMKPGSKELAEFNRAAKSAALAWRRSQSVWIKNSPRFGQNYETDWKEYFEYLDINPAFVQPIGNESVWEGVDKKLETPQNIWAEVIQRFRLLDMPYGTASVPSLSLFKKEEVSRQERINTKLNQLCEAFHTNNEQSAITQYEKQEGIKTREIDEIGMKVPVPSFTDSPPLTRDPGIQYAQLELVETPITAVFFERPPTIDLGLSFDLHQLPPKYYKYLPLLPRALEALGIRNRDRVTGYSELQNELQTKFNSFVIDYGSNPISDREELRIRASAFASVEMNDALNFISKLITHNDLNAANLGRLRDIIAKQDADAANFGRGDDDFWFMNPSHAFRYQDDSLYMAVSSQLTQNHWTSRLKWMLHTPVAKSELLQLSRFSAQTLAQMEGFSPQDIASRLRGLKANGVVDELRAYWIGAIDSFPPDHVVPGLKQLASEVENDLSGAPFVALRELRETETIILDRKNLRINVTLDQADFSNLKTELQHFIISLPTSQEDPKKGTLQKESSTVSLLTNLRQRYTDKELEFPRYVGFVHSGDSYVDAAFLSGFPGYKQIDRSSLLRVLASKLVSGTGPHSVYMKSKENGLAYGSSVTSDPNVQLLRFYALRSPDIVALTNLVFSLTEAIGQSRRQTKRFYWRDKHREKAVRKIVRCDLDTLQWLVMYESDLHGVQQDQLSQQTETQLLIRYVNRVVQASAALSSFYVNIGVSRLIYGYSTLEAQGVYEFLTGRYLGPDEYRRAKSFLIKKVADGFGGLLETIRVEHGEIRFVQKENQQEVINVVEKCLNAFTPWSTQCESIANLSAQIAQTNVPDIDQNSLDLTFCHVLLHPDCYADLTNRVSLDHPHKKVAVPRFAMSNIEENDKEPPTAPPILGPEDIQEIRRKIEIANVRRREIKPRWGRVVLDNQEVKRFDLAEQRGFQIPITKENTVVEIYAEDETGKILVATHIISDDERHYPIKSTVPVTAGRFIFQMTEATWERGQATDRILNIAYSPQAKLADVWEECIDIFKRPSLRTVYGMSCILIALATWGLAHYFYSHTIDTLTKDLQRERQNVQIFSDTRGMISYVLTPDELRVRSEDTRMPEIKAQPSSPAIALKLRMLGSTAGQVYTVELKRVQDEQLLMTQSDLHSVSTDQGIAVQILIPTELLKETGLYTVLLNSGERVNRFSFRVAEK